MKQFWKDTMCNAPAWHHASAITDQKICWELLVQRFDRFQTTRQLPTTCNMVCKRTQHVTSNNVGGFWPTMLRPFARLPRVSGRFEFRFKELSSTHIDDKFTLFSVISAPGNTNISCLVHSYFSNKYIQYKIIQL